MGIVIKQFTVVDHGSHYNYIVYSRYLKMLLAKSQHGMWEGCVTVTEMLPPT